MVLPAQDLNGINGFTGIRAGLLNLWVGGWSNLPSGITQQIVYLITIGSGWIGTAQILVCQKAKVYTRLYYADSGWSAWF